MPQYNFTLQNQVLATPGGTLSFIPSASLFNVTSSNNATPASLNLNVSSSLPSNIINNTTLNPYIRFTLISGSNSNSDLVIRFFSQSHIQTKYTSSNNKNNPNFVFPESSSLYFTGSSTDNIEFVNVKYTSGLSGIALGGLIHDAITSSRPHKTGLISASKSNTSTLHTTTINYTNIRGEITVTPTVYTGSGAIPLGSNIEATYSTSGSGGFNFAEAFVISPESASLLIGPTNETTDTSNISFRQGTGSPSFIASGKTDPTLMYFSSSGKIGFGTKDPKADVDISGSIQGVEIVTKPTTGRPIRIRDSEIKFYETTQTDPNHADYGDNKERARIKATSGSFNLTFEVSGSSGYTNSVYISQSGKIGFNTDDPQSEFDAIVSEVQFQTPGSRKGLRINNEGNIESFNKDAASAATGSEFILKYSRGASVTQASLATVGITVEDDSGATTFFNALKAVDQNAILEKIEANGFIASAQTGDTLGAIRWIAESGSLTTLDPRSTGETAVLKAVVSDIDATGVQADLIFSVAGKTGAAEQKFLIDAGNNHEITGSLDITSNLNAVNATLSGDITLANNRKIKNANESNTYIQVVNDDYWRINANNINVAQFASTHFKVNPDSGPTVDFIVNSDNNVAINMNANDETLTFGVPITASGDISSSGAITSLSGSIDHLLVNDKLQGNGAGFQFFAYNEDTSKVKFANWYTDVDNQYGMGMLWYETYFAAIDTDGNANDVNRRIGFYLEQPEAGATDSTSGQTGRHPNNARFYVDINGSYLSGSFTSSGDISSSGAITANSITGKLNGGSF